MSAPPTRRESLLSALAVEGASRCCYMPGAGNPEAWPTARCDCKYVVRFIGPAAPPAEKYVTSEMTGCCEIRAAYRLLADEIGVEHS